MQEIRLLIASITTLFLFGCVSDHIKLGIIEPEWSSYSSDKQQMLLSNYKKLAEEHHTTIKEKRSAVASGNTFLEVNIHSGQVMIPPFGGWQDYKPVNFIIFQEQCRDIILQQATDENSQTKLGVCYHENILHLDPSHYDFAKKNGSISINSSPLWLSGFSYKKISSSGYVRLNNVTVEITRKEKTN